MKNLFLFLVLVFGLMAAIGGAVGQGIENPLRAESYLEQFRGKPFAESVAKIWLEVCAINRGQYPDSNLVRPGDVIRLPLGQKYTAKAGGNDHMWRAAVYFTETIVLPYFTANAVAVTQKPTEVLVERGSNDNSSALWILLFILLLTLITAFWFARWKERRPFLKKRPDFLGASDSQLRNAFREASQHAFGYGFEIVGAIERGRINGEQTVFFGEGNYVTEKYRDEPGYRGRLRFRDGTEAVVVSRAACFNPCWSASGARFQGTFTPEGGRPEEIETISPSQAGHLSQVIKNLRENEGPGISMASILPDAHRPEPAREEQPTPSATPSPAKSQESQQEEDGKMKLTKLQVSKEKGLTLEGEIPLTVDELKELITQVKGEEEKKQ